MTTRRNGLEKWILKQTGSNCLRINLHFITVALFNSTRVIITLAMALLAMLVSKLAKYKHAPTLLMCPALKTSHYLCIVGYLNKVDYNSDIRLVLGTEWFNR